MAFWANLLGYQATWFAVVWSAGRGTPTGAGTTLTKDAPPDALTVSRAKQMTLPGWTRPQKVKK